MDCLTNVQLTDEQRAILDFQGPELLVQASAGSGKTTVIIEKYLQAIDAGLRPYQILTTTFTVRAAAELKTRIIRKLRERERWDLIQEAETGPIQTLASFCDRALRENALLAGVDTQFEVSTDGSRHFAAAVEAALDEGESGDENFSILWKAVKTKGEVATNPYPAVKESLVELLRVIRSDGYVLEDLEAKHQNPHQLVWQWREAMKQAAGFEGELDLQSLNFDHDLANSIRATGRPVPAWLGSRTQNYRELLNQAKLVCASVQLACRAWRICEDEMLREQKFDFLAIERKFVALLRNNPKVQQRLSRQYRLVMVDEAQDMSPQQHQLIEALRPDGLLMVGDDKQSIYGWRQADVRLYKEKTKTLPVLKLTKNFRSSGPIQKFVDRVFGSIWSEEYAPMLAPAGFDEIDIPEGIEQWKLPQEGSFRLVAQQLKAKIDAGHSPSSVCILVRQNKRGVELKAALESVGLVARLDQEKKQFYTRMEIRDMANLMLSVTDSRDEFALLCALRSPYVDLSFDAISTLALAKPVSASIFTIELTNAEDQRKLEKFRQWLVSMRKVADRLPAWEVLSLIIERLRVAQILLQREGGDQQFANIRKLLALASANQNEGPREFAERAKELASLRFNESEAGEAHLGEAIQVMTVHKAKGLEWDSVLLADSIDAFAAMGAWITAPALGLVAGDDSATIFFRYVRSLRTERDAEEADRLLYVALTRARQNLWILTDENNKSKNISSRLRERLNAKVGDSSGIPTVYLGEE